MPQPYSTTRASSRGSGECETGAAMNLRNTLWPLAKKLSSSSGENPSGGASTISRVLITANRGFSRAMRSQLIPFQCLGRSATGRQAAFRATTHSARSLLGLW